MTDNKLRILAGSIVTKSKMSKPAKLQMLTFIQKEASISQIKALLLDGKILSVNEKKEKDINERFDKSNLSKIVVDEKLLSEVSVLGLTVAAAVAAPLFGAYRATKALFSRKSRKCGTFSIGAKRSLCLKKIKAEEYRQMAKLAQKAMEYCKSHKNPELCKQKNLAVAQKYEDKANQLDYKITKYGSKGGKQTKKLVKGLKRAEKYYK